MPSIDPLAPGGTLPLEGREGALTAVKLAALYRVWEPALGARFYCFSGGGALCTLGEQATVCLADAGQWPQAEEFLRFCGVRRYLVNLPVGGEERRVLACRCPPGPPSALEGPPLAEVAALLARWDTAFGGSVFYGELSHRLRHGAALLAGARADGALRATAGVYALDPGSRQGVIEQVYTQLQYRGRGLAARALADLRAALPGYRLLLCCAPERASFYQFQGFAPCQSTWEGIIQ
ncbi:GNAT family N-acetyltransferase [Bittarella massiliensis (ex Durand et al. 2017)]|uniref:GNAT family N-acetyltransferase n=1 Tax=Bittarella massiliensis (ex Durand et al. 2017) TaxID=1720313 RepID=UPI001AA0BF42|nr:GNAT family N-acetyltransferase [Bittarella massiliensis (ex Durand et al. 2017)]MBO1679881.1 hypothetical protein [Bittarella massiliensis (ex Durand et al. 2017)]